MGTFRLCSEYPTGTAAASWPEAKILRDLFGRMDPGFNGLLVDSNTAPKFILFDPASPGTAAPTTWPPGPGGLPVTKVAGPILLDPNQCLVVFLSGGTYTDYLGFATSPSQPFKPPIPNLNEQRLAGSPFFDGFTKSRERMKSPVDWFTERMSLLDTLPNLPSPTLASGGIRRWEAAAPNNDTVSTVSNEPWYLDPFGTPYLYLATSGIGTGGDYPTTPLLIGPWGGRFSGYNRTPANQLPNAAAYTGFPNVGMMAFRDTANRYWNHTTYQIISAGLNGSKVRNDIPWGFGRNPAPGIATFGVLDFDLAKGAGGDDYANFRDTGLGVRD